MKFQIKICISTSLALALLTGWATPAYAQTVVSVTPSSVVNDVNNKITVAGTGFDNTAVVLLNGYAIDTVFSNDQTLRATVPAGFAPGTYTVTVTMTGVVVVGSDTLDITAPTPTAPPPATAPATATATTSPFGRPQMIVNSSKANVNAVSSGKEFKFTIDFGNVGSVTAYSAQAVFTSADLVPTETGGVIVLGNVAPGGSASAAQTFVSSASLYGKTVVLIDVTLTYYDDKGTSYSDKFTLSVRAAGASTGSGVIPTSTEVKSGQLIIPSYGTTVNPLQPGNQFTLTMTVQNAGNDTARRVTMIVGGGSSGSEGGTPQPGGVSGAGGEFTNFAPVGTSNLKSLGDLAAGGMAQVSQELIVNVSTNPGAYPMKITFSYLNGKGESVNDEQVITLLVYSLPNVEVSFYRPLDPFFQGQPGMLPIQIVNLGKRTAVLGNMKVTSNNGMIENGETLVGALDAGGYYTLDATLAAENIGETELKVVIEYVDDFNQSRTIEKTLTVDVGEAFMEPMPGPGTQGGGGGGESVYIPPEETFLQKTWRLILGLLGLDSAPPSPTFPATDFPLQEIPAPVNPSSGGKG